MGSVKYIFMLLVRRIAILLKLSHKISYSNCYCQIFSGFAFPFEPLVVSFALLSLVFVVFATEMLV